MNCGQKGVQGVNKQDPNAFTRSIFQTWKSTTVIPKNMAYWQSTWKLHNPEYMYTLWDDDMNRRFIKTHYSWFLDQYDEYDRNIKRADVIRYFYLYTYGGIYADMDFECLKPFESLLTQCEDDYDVLLGKMNTTEAFAVHSIPNAIMISKPKADFWLCVIYMLIHSASSYTPEEATGPIVLQRALELYSSGDTRWYDYMKRIMGLERETCYPDANRVKVFQPDVFYPLSWDVDREIYKTYKDDDLEKMTQLVKRDFPQAYAFTYWTHTW